MTWAQLGSIGGRDVGDAGIDLDRRQRRSTRRPFDYQGGTWGRPARPLCGSPISQRSLHLDEDRTSKAAAAAQTGKEEEDPVTVAEAAGYVGNWEEV